MLQDSGLSKQVDDKVIHLGRTPGRGTSVEKHDLQMLHIKWTLLKIPVHATRSDKDQIRKWGNRRATTEERRKKVLYV